MKQTTGFEAIWPDLWPNWFADPLKNQNTSNGLHTDLSDWLLIFNLVDWLWSWSAVVNWAVTLYYVCMCVLNFFVCLCKIQALKLRWMERFLIHGSWGCDQKTAICTPIEQLWMNLLLTRDGILVENLWVCLCLSLKVNIKLKSEYSQSYLLHGCEASGQFWSKSTGFEAGWPDL